MSAERGHLTPERSVSNLPSYTHTRRLAGAAVLGALALGLAVVSVPLRFPLLPFLIFDLAEIPVVLAFLWFGPLPGVATAVIHWIGLNYLPTFLPGVGPLMKLAAELSMLLGLWIGLILASRLKKGARSSSRLVLAFGLGAAIRMLIMTPLNAVVFFVFPAIQEFTTSTVSRLYGASPVGIGDVLVVGLLLIAIFNGLHVVVNVFPAYGVIKGIMLRVSSGLPKAWFFKEK